MKNENYKIILGAVVGAAVAGVATLLFAPKSGKDLRKDMSNQAEDAMDTAEDYMGIAKDKGTDMKETVQEAGSEMMENRQEAMGQMEREIKGAVNHAEQGRDQVAKMNAGNAQDTYRRARNENKEIVKDAAEEVKDTAVEAKEEAEKQ